MSHPMALEQKMYNMKQWKVKIKNFKHWSQMGESLVCQTEEFRFHLVSNWESLRYFGEEHPDAITDQMNWME